ncbi:MAG: RtcB family protein [Phycisphaerales bacterium]|nr:RtcB family protein [Phycisphaerales bacterium]
MNEPVKHILIPTGDATAMLPVTNSKTPPITVIGTAAIRETFSNDTLQQAVNTRLAPGVDEVVLNPDAHIGFGAPIGCVMASGSHIYPGPVGVDIKCSMSLLQLDLPSDAICDRRTRRAVIDAICERTPTGAGRGQRSVRKSRRVPSDVATRAVIEGASAPVCDALGIPAQWAGRCEDSHHLGHDETSAALELRLETLLKTDVFTRFDEKLAQLGSYGGGNHFGECEIVHVSDNPRARDAAAAFGLRDGHVAFLSHCGSRGFGHNLAMGQFRAMQTKFRDWNIPFPAGDRELCYAPLGTPEANAYLDDMALGANFATVNHMLINALVLEAFQEVFPGTTGALVYFISHNIARREQVRGRTKWVMRKGATRAFPAGHAGLAGTPFEQVGHPILLPGDPQRGSAVMVAEAGAQLSCYSVNHGAGRMLGRKQAIRSLDQAAIDRSFEERDILTNCRNYPRDEAPAAYKDFEEVIRSVTLAGLASQVARLEARFVIKDASDADD